MPARTLVVAVLLVVLSFSTRAARGQERARRHAGYQTWTSKYGYRPYRPRIGPIRARYELDDYVYSPRRAGVDYSYGIGYFFGRGPGDRAYQTVERQP